MPSNEGVPGVRTGVQQRFWDMGRDDTRRADSLQAEVTTRPALWLDPGGTTGWAYWSQDDYSIGQVSTEQIWALLNAFRPGLRWLGYERFGDIDQSIKTVDLTPAEVIGVVKEWHRQNILLHPVKLVSQQPRMKEFFTDARIKQKGLWTPGRPHGMDALRHLLYFRHDYSGLR